MESQTIINKKMKAMKSMAKTTNKYLTDDFLGKLSFNGLLANIHPDNRKRFSEKWE